MGGPPVAMGPGPGGPGGFTQHPNMVAPVQQQPQMVPPSVYPVPQPGPGPGGIPMFQQPMMYQSPQNAAMRVSGCGYNIVYPEMWCIF